MQKNQYKVCEMEVILMTSFVDGIVMTLASDLSVFGSTPPRM